MELKQLKTDGSSLDKWLKFLEAIYSEFLNNRELYKLREEFSLYLDDPNTTLHQKYKFLISNTILKKYHSRDVENEARKTDAFGRELFIKYFRNILSRPSLAKTKEDTVEITGLNLNFSEVEQELHSHLTTELKKSRLRLKFCFTKTEPIQLTTLNDSSEDYLKQYLNGEIDIADGLKNLLDRYLISLVKKSSSLDGSKIKEDTLICLNEQEYKISDLKMKQILDNLKIGYFEVLKSYAKTIKIIAGNNIYMDERKTLNLPGINFAVVAGQDIILAEEFSLNTSGKNGFKLADSQAYGVSKAAPKLCAGLSGEDGLDGFSGENGGHIFIKAERNIVNIERISSLKSSGGNGSPGQKGGCGQKGGVGQDTGDAEADEPPSSVTPSFVAAFARIPGYNIKTGKFDDESEKSGNGGNAGKAGLGGEAGFAGEISIRDSLGWIKNKNDEKEAIECSSNLKVLIDKLNEDKKLNCSQGTKGDDASEDVSGGEAGEPGTYGCDHVRYNDNFYERTKDKKGNSICKIYSCNIYIVLTYYFLH